MKINVIMYRFYQYIRRKAFTLNPPSIKAFYIRYMVIIGTIGQVMHYIQAWKIFSTKSASDISLVAYVISFFLLLNWMIYGVIISSKPLIYAEITGLIGASMVIIGVIIYS